LVIPTTDEENNPESIVVENEEEEILDESSSNYHTRRDAGRRSLNAPENVHLHKLISGSGRKSATNGD
jgi:hypothetical protein